MFRSAPIGQAGVSPRGSLQQALVDGVLWLNLLMLPVRPQVELKLSTQQILKRRPDLLSTVFTKLFERFPTSTPTPS